MFGKWQDKITRHPVTRHGGRLTRDHIAKPMHGAPRIRQSSIIAGKNHSPMMPNDIPTTPVFWIAPKLIIAICAVWPPEHINTNQFTVHIDGPDDLVLVRHVRPPAPLRASSAQPHPQRHPAPGPADNPLVWSEPRKGSAPQRSGLSAPKREGPACLRKQTGWTGLKAHQSRCQVQVRDQGPILPLRNKKAKILNSLLWIR